MNKTSPIGVRFDPEKLDFIKKKESLKSYQQVVDFLVNKYWWDHKVPVPTHKEAPPLHLKEQEAITTREQEKGPILSISTSRLSLSDFQTISSKYLEEKKEINSPEEHHSWLKKLRSDIRLSEDQRDQIIKAI